MYSRWLKSLAIFAAIYSLALLALAQPFNPDPASRWKTWQGGSAAVKTPALRDGNVYKLTPAEIIYWSARENDLNPLLLLVKLQAEQGLIQNAYPVSELQRRLDRAVGYGVFESSPSTTNWGGFYPQLVGMSYEFSQMRKKKDFHSAFLEYTPHEDKYLELQNIYSKYALQLNQVSGKNYATTPSSTGYLSDFRDVSTLHIQMFLERFAGNLKNSKLFVAGIMLPTPPVSPTAGAKVTNNPGIPTQLAQNGKLAFTVQLDKPADQVKIVFQNPQAEVALAGQGTAWSLPERPITTAGSRPWVIQVISGGQVTDAHVSGTLNVVADSGLPPPSNPTMQSVQVSGLAQEGSVSTFIFNGQALNGSVLVTIANCDNPKTELVNASQIKHSCIPRVAGALATGWKPNSSTVTPVSLGSVSVQPAQFDSPPPSILTAEQLGRMVLGANYATVTQPYLARYDRAPVEPSGVIGTGYHPGIDYRAAVGTDVLSPVDGVVTVGGGGTYGTITIQMDGSQTRVLLMHTSSSYLKVGDRVTVGCIVGKSGQAGTDAPHLHVETRTGRDGGAFYFKSPANVGVNLNPLSVVRGFVTPPARPVICGRSDQPPPPTNAMSFVSETVPDGTVLNASSPFNKTWTLKNTGTTTWDSSYCLRPVSGDALAAANASVCVARAVAPNANYTFSAAMVAPAAKKTDATYKQVWALSKTGAAAFGTQVSAQVAVKGQVGIPPPPIPLNIQSFGTNVPAVAVNQNLTFNVTVDNPTAVDKVNLVFPDANVTEAMTQVAGGASWTRTRTMSTVGNNLTYEVWVYKKGDAANPIKRAGTYSVTAAAPPAQDGMSFVSGSLAQNTVVNPQSGFSASWTLRNTGNTTWNSQYCLKPKGNAGVNAGNVCVNGSVAPNAQVTFNSANLQSPAASTSEQNITQEWELINANNVKVGDVVFVKIVVKAKAAPAPVQPPPPVVQPTPPAQPKPVTPPPSACTTTGAKVCGTNGVTYSNACLMREAGATLRKAGAC